jgi:predicted RNA binding protein YcfA (HicA-like mRNA interferase family)
MATLPILSGKEVVKRFEYLGWRVARQSSSHIIMTKEGEIATLSIPDHKEVAKGTLRSLIRSANLTINEFIKAAQTNVH